jgi:hypothetical protein
MQPAQHSSSPSGFAFVCHHNSRACPFLFSVSIKRCLLFISIVVLIYGSLRTPTIDSFAYITHISTGFSIVASITMGLSGYLVFTNKTQGNVLNNFGPNGKSIDLISDWQANISWCRPLDKHCTFVFRPQYDNNLATRVFCVSRGVSRPYFGVVVAAPTIVLMIYADNGNILFRR